MKPNNHDYILMNYTSQVCAMMSEFFRGDRFQHEVWGAAVTPPIRSLVKLW